jgi:hypothetical protein
MLLLDQSIIPCCAVIHIHVFHLKSQYDAPQRRIRSRLLLACLLSYTTIHFLLPLPVHSIDRNPTPRPRIERHGEEEEE